LRSIELSQICFSSSSSMALLAAFEEGSLVTILIFTNCYWWHGGDEEQTGTLRAIVQALQRNLSVKTLSLCWNVI
jgi:hypothetical protein